MVYPQLLMGYAERYELIEQIHDGRNVKVFRGIDREDGSRVILKILKSGATAERLRSEYAILRNLNLSCIVPVRRLEEQGGEVALVSEDVGGETLSARIARGRVPLADVLRIAAQAADGLGRIHQLRIIHKDINPSNILLRDNGEIRIFDFDIATRLPREDQSIRTPNMLAGTLLYISPEQTGRMNRAIDYRTDFYSLGATLYLLLVGDVPFSVQDPMELVHCHIAKTAIPPALADPSIPEVVSDIVMKLLEKTAEARYQSAFGMKADFEECIRRLEQFGRIDPFPLCQRDVSERFEIPQKLYGRSQEITALEQAFNRARQGHSEMLLVAGSSGIGKSSIIHELYRFLAPRGSYLVSGKFDQLKRDIPYSGLLLAVSDLVRNLLAESDERLTALRKRILAAVSGAGRILTDAVPDLEHIIGPQAPVPELSAVEGRNRFRIVFESFIRVFSQRDAEQDGQLVIFLDDLQWADAATLDLLPTLLGHRNADALLVIGAYRDSEVSGSHPMLSTLEVMKREGCRLTKIAVGPINVDDVSHLVQDTLSIDHGAALPLAQLLWRRTGGNPLFVNELLTVLYKTGLLEFNLSRGIWSFNLAAVEAAPSTENIGQLMAARAASLRDETREILQLAAVLGSQFDIETLAIVAELPRDGAKSALEQALEEGLILVMLQGQRELYRFLHDRVQQAVYGSIALDKRTDVHCRTGRLLWRSRSDHNNDEWLFNVLYHMNLARERIEDPKERLELVALNVTAAKRAIASGAFSAAATHYATGIHFLPQDAWSSHHDLMFMMHLGWAECEFGMANHAESGRLFDLLLKEARTDLEQVQVYELKTSCKVHLGEYHDALGPALKALGLLGIRIDANAKLPAIGVEFLKTKRAIRGRSPRELRDLPATADPLVHLTHRMLVATLMAGFFVGPLLYLIVTLKLVQHSLKMGFTKHTAAAFSIYAGMLASFGSYEECDAFGRLSLDLLKRFPDKNIEAQITNGYGYFVSSWRNPAKEGLRYLEISEQSSIMAGDKLTAGFAMFNTALLMMMTGTPLDALSQKCSSYLDFARKNKHDLAEKVLATVHQAALSLAGLTRSPGSYDTDTFSEDRFVAQLSAQSSKVELGHYWIFKVMVLFIFERYDEILSIPDIYRKILSREIDNSPMLVSVEYHFYDALVLLAINERRSALARQRDILLVRNHLRRLKKWADSAPMNFRRKYLLVQAELSRLQKDDHAAMGHYEEAILLAREHGALHDEAIALELAGKFYRSRRLSDIAVGYFSRARSAYARWGAHAKVTLLDQEFPGLAGRSTENSPASTMSTTITSNTSTSSSLDVPSLIKATQALSSEVSLNKLILRLMNVVAENAGAQYGALILKQQGALMVVAEFAVNGGAHLPERSVRLDETATVSRGIVNYVFRTQRHVVLNDATAEGAFTMDPYVVSHKTKAVLCSPLIQRADVAGALYLENNLVAGAFTTERAEMLGVLCAQMAISIDNAYLYADLEQKVIERTRALEQAQAKLVKLEKEATENQMAGGFAHEMRNALSGAQIMLASIYREKGVETWSACNENSARLGRLAIVVKEDVPPAKIALFSQLLKELNATEQKVNAVLVRIERAIVRSLHVTRLVLSYAEVSKELAGGEPISVRVLVMSVLEDLDLKDHQIFIDVDVSADCNLVGSEPHFRVILSNLVTNARDAILDSTSNLPRRITIRAIDAPDSLVLSVEDTGAGIPPELREKIFDPFFSTKPSSGTGLGLGMAKKIASLYGGAIEIDSEVGQGTTFRIVFPKERQEAFART
jgi:histidine kinase